MDQTVRKALELLREIKSVAFATVNNGQPAVRIIDMMLAEEEGLYFLTAGGKEFYTQLKEDRKPAIWGMDRNYVSVRAFGEIEAYPAASCGECARCCGSIL